MGDLFALELEELNSVWCNHYKELSLETQNLKSVDWKLREEYDVFSAIPKQVSLYKNFEAGDLMSKLSWEIFR
jgi:hypothetical protein